MNSSFWAYREAAEIPDRDDYGPQVHVLWDKQHIARKAHLCTTCGDEISAGTRYRSMGAIVDGDFETSKVHFPGCPRFMAKERAELEAQFEADKAECFPAERDPRPINDAAPPSAHDTSERQPQIPGSAQ